MEGKSTGPSPIRPSAIGVRRIFGGNLGDRCRTDPFDEILRRRKSRYGEEHVCANRGKSKVRDAVLHAVARRKKPTCRSGLRRSSAIWNGMPVPSQNFDVPARTYY